MQSLLGQKPLLHSSLVQPHQQAALQQALQIGQQSFLKRNNTQHVTHDKPISSLHHHHHHRPQSLHTSSNPQLPQHSHHHLPSHLLPKNVVADSPALSTIRPHLLSQQQHKQFPEFPHQNINWKSISESIINPQQEITAQELPQCHEQIIQVNELSRGKSDTGFPVNRFSWQVSHVRDWLKMKGYDEVVSFFKRTNGAKLLRLDETQLQQRLGKKNIAIAQDLAMDIRDLVKPPSLVPPAFEIDSLSSDGDISTLTFTQSPPTPAIIPDYSSSVKKIDKWFSLLPPKTKNSAPFPVFVILGFMKTGKSTILQKILPAKIAQSYSNYRILSLDFDHYPKSNYREFVRLLLEELHQWGINNEVPYQYPTVSTTATATTLEVKILNFIDAIGRQSSSTFLLLDEIQKWFQYRERSWGERSGRLLKSILYGSSTGEQRSSLFSALTGSHMVTILEGLSTMSPSGVYPFTHRVTHTIPSVGSLELVEIVKKQFKHVPESYLSEGGSVPPLVSHFAVEWEAQKASSPHLTESEIALNVEHKLREEYKNDAAKAIENMDRNTRLQLLQIAWGIFPKSHFSSTLGILAELFEPFKIQYSLSEWTPSMRDTWSAIHKGEQTPPPLVSYGFVPSRFTTYTKELIKLDGSIKPSFLSSTRSLHTAGEWERIWDLTGIGELFSPGMYEFLNGNEEVLPPTYHEFMCRFEECSKSFFSSQGVELTGSNCLHNSLFQFFVGQPWTQKLLHKVENAIAAGRSSNIPVFSILAYAVKCTFRSHLPSYARNIERNAFEIFLPLGPQWSRVITEDRILSSLLHSPLLQKEFETVKQYPPLSTC